MSNMIIKRNGTKMDFDGTKIYNAVAAATAEVKPEHVLSEAQLQTVVEMASKQILASEKDMSVEEIQDIVELAIMSVRGYEVAQHYIRYRHNRELARRSNTTDDNILDLIKGSNKEMNEENSNKDTKMASTQRDYIAGVTSRDLTERVLLPEKISKAHKEGILHFHDADYFIQPIFNCCLINIGDMLDNGTVMNGKMIESPKSFQVACTVMTQIIASVASNQYGGQSVDVSHLGKYLRISKEKIKRRLHEECGDEFYETIPDDVRERIVQARLRDELKSGVQTIQYQINTLMTTNGQAPFVTLFMNLQKDDPYLEENAMIVEEILKQRLEGIKNEAGVYVTPTFPKLVYVLDELNCLKGGKYDYITKLAVKCSAKRMYPDYISAKKMREYYNGNTFSPMGCRSFLTLWKDENGKYKFEGRFNQGVVSINLPQIVLEVTDGGKKIPETEDEFWKMLDERIELCREALMCRHKALLGTKSDISPIHWQYGAIARLKKGEVIDPYLKNNYSTLSLGYIGIYELTKLMKGCSQTDPEGKEFALRVMTHLRDTCYRWKDETGLGFSLYGTPAESLCYRFAKIDQEKFGDVEDVTDKGYYTNSYHVDVREHIDAFSKFAIEAEFQALSPGGKISYVEIPNMNHNLEALEELVKFIYDNIQYAEFNTKSDYCHACGFDGEIKLNDNMEWECPNCHCKDHSKLTVIRRTCGYLGQWWNVGKTLELKSRALHL